MSENKVSRVTALVCYFYNHKKRIKIFNQVLDVCDIFNKLKPGSSILFIHITYNYNIAELEYD